MLTSVKDLSRERLRVNTAFRDNVRDGSFARLRLSDAAWLTHDSRDSRCPTGGRSAPRRTA